MTDSLPGRHAGWLALLLLAGVACGGAGDSVTSTPSGATPPTSTPAAEAIQPTPTLVTAAAATPQSTAEAPTPASVPATATTTPQGLGPAILARAGTVVYNLTYCTTGGVDLKMDVYHPNELTSAVPVVVFIHGGGWTSGDKRQAEPVFVDGLRADGFMVISLNYRLAPEFPYPAQIEDVKCAVRHLRAEAARYGLDPNAIGAAGTSAGAHLAAMLGVTDAEAGWDTGAYLEQSSQVSAVVAFFVAADLTLEFPGIAFASSEGAFGASFDAALLKEASPISYVTADDAAFLLIHGAQDAFVPPSQSQILHERLIAAGVESEVVLVEGGRHAFLAMDYPVQPSREELTAKSAAFFSLHLRR